MSRHDALHKYLLRYRATPHCTTGYSPAELQMGRKLRTRLSAITTSARENVYRSQARQQIYYRGNRNVEFDREEVLMAKNYAKDQWQKVQVIRKLGPVTYSVRTDDDLIWKRL